MTNPVLEVCNLSIRYGSHEAVNDVSFSVVSGEIVALVGRSGAGKSSIINAIMDLLPGDAVVDGSILVNGSRCHEVGKWRNTVVALVPQDPFSWFNPLTRVGKQLAEIGSKQRALDLLSGVGFVDADCVAKSIPDELSGGMRQRCAIAGALTHQPPVILADEPTSALDRSSQDEILSLLQTCRDAGQALLLVSHDRSVVERMADRVLYIEDGVLVEELSSSAIVRQRKPVEAGHSALAARNLRVAFPKQPIVDNFAFDVASGETVALVGESGVGKTTICRVLAGLRRAEGGVVDIDGIDPISVDRSSRAKAVQMVFQDARGSLDPRLTARESVEEPLKNLGLFNHDRVTKAFDQAGLPEYLRDKRPSMLSGGEVQRAAIARALAIQPKVLILDEPFSAIDVQTRDELVARLIDIQESTQIGIVVVLHDTDLAANFAHRVVTL